MPKEPLSLVWVVLNTTAIYAFLVAALTLLGRREITQLGFTELVIIALLGSSIETSMIAGDTSLLAGLICMIALLVENRALSVLLRRWSWLHRIMLGRPIPVVYNGRLLERRMRQAGLTEEDVRAAVRARGYDGLDKVRLAMLELDGAISVLPRE